MNQGLFASPARALEVTRTSSGGLQLSGLSCDEVNRQLLQLEKWVNPATSSHCSTPRAMTTASGCAAEITDCVPRHVVDHHGTRAPHDGPNCFNLVMVSKGVMPFLVETSAEEMALYKKSPMCRKLGPKEPKRAGDVGSILSGTGELHGFIYATDQLAYSKNGLTKDAPYVLTSLRAVLDLYGVGQRSSDRQDSECYRSGEPECRVKIRADYYRCKAVDEYLKEAPQKPLKAKAAQATHLFDQIDCRLSKSLFEPDAATPALRSEIQTMAGILKNYLETEVSTELASSRPDPQERFILGMLKLRIDNFSYNLPQSPIPQDNDNWLYELTNAADSVLAGTEN